MVCSLQQRKMSQNQSANKVEFDSEKCHPPPTVQTSYGSVQGFRHRISNGSEVDIFLGIPFAKPPIGELRFEKPVPPIPWHPALLQALQFGPAAIPINWDAVPELVCSEDCLHLNLFRPTVRSKQARPVLVYIHGGGFAYGSTREYGFQGWTERFGAEDILMVTIQYRLGPFGFLTLGDGALPGNLGLWDMAAALSFVHAEIGVFGGDPTRITVAGQSAGGAAASSMALSPHTKDFLCASVEMSGTAMAEWSTSARAVQVGRQFARRVLGTEADDWDAERIKRKLKTLNAEQIWKIAKEMGPRLDPNLLIWTPHIDGDFLPRDFPELIRENQPKPVLMGVTAKESLYFTIQARDPFINPFGLSREQLASYDGRALREFIRQVVLGGEFRRHLSLTAEKETLDATIQEAADIIYGFYTKSDNDAKNQKQRKVVADGKENNRQMLELYTRLISDLMFNVPMFWMARHRVKCQNPVFLYLNEYFNEQQFEQWTPVKGSTHGNEYPYINGLFPVGEFEFNEADNRHQAIMVQMLSSFVRTGKPSVPGIKEWPSNVSENENFEFLRIDGDGAHLGPSSGSTEDQTFVKMDRSQAFWAWFSTKYGFNLIRGIPVPAGKSDK